MVLSSSHEDRSTHGAGGRFTGSTAGPHTDAAGGFAASLTDASPDDYSQEEKDQAREYQNGSAVNGYLRDAESGSFISSVAKQSLNSPQSQRQIAALDSAIGKGLLKNDATLYRGVNFNLASFPDAGQTFRDPAFVSTSANSRIASGFGSIVEIHAPAGTHAMDMSHALGDRSRYQQQEIMLGRNTKFKVVSKTPQKIVVHVV